MRPAAEQQAAALAKARGVSIEEARALLAKAVAKATTRNGTGTGH